MFLFLQGPHGPFFTRVADKLTETGAHCWRVAFNAGDGSMWSDPATLLPFHQTLDDWPDTFTTWLQQTGATDLVLYGDTRQHHAEALAIARAAGLTIHVFEEGYLRPYWATYERDGSNGNSRLMQITLDEMRQALSRTADLPALPPDRWGDLRMHMVHGALYHWHVPRRSTAARARREFPGFFTLHLADRFRPLRGRRLRHGRRIASPACLQGAPA